MKKIVINKCYGGFGLSYKAVMRYAEIKDIKLYGWVDDIAKQVYGDKATLDNPSICVHYCTIPIKDESDYEKKTKKNDDIFWSDHDIERIDSALIQVVKEMGAKANGRCANLQIIEIPNKTKWQIEEYDGIEWVAEKHKTWN